MRIESIEYKVYSFFELDEKGKEKVRNWYLDNQDSSAFAEDCKYYLKDKFHNSDLDVEFQLGYVQGDGLNVYGSLDLMDLYERIIEKNPDLFIGKERKFLEWVLCTYLGDYSLPKNHIGCCCMSNHWDFVADIIADMEYDHIRNIKYAVLGDFNAAAIEIMEQICSDLQKMGYEYFYEISDEDLEEFCESNGYEFLADGSVFN